MRVRSIVKVVLALALCSAVGGFCQESLPAKPLKTPLVYRNSQVRFLSGTAIGLGWLQGAERSLEREWEGWRIGAKTRHPESALDGREALSGYSDPGVHSRTMAFDRER